MAARRALVLQRRSRPHRDAVRPRQRLPGDAGQPGGGARGPQPRHLPERVPRDVADPARRGGLRLRQDRPDDRQRARRQAAQAVRRRRTAVAADRRPRLLRARRRLPQRRADPRHDLAHAGRQARAGVVAADGELRAPPPRRDDLRDHAARRRGAGGGLLAAPQPSGRRGRVPREGRRPRRGQGPAPGPQVHRTRPATTVAARGRQRDRARIPVRQQQDDARLRDAPPHRHLVPGRRHHQRRPRPRQDRVHRAGHAGRPDQDHQARVVPLVERRPGSRAGRPVLAHAGARRGATASSRSSTSSAPGSTTSGPTPTSNSEATTAPSRRCGGTCSSWPRRRREHRSRASPPRASREAATTATTSGTPRCTWRRSSPTRCPKRRGRSCASGGGCSTPLASVPAR